LSTIWVFFFNYNEQVCKASLDLKIEWGAALIISNLAFLAADRRRHFALRPVPPEVQPLHPEAQAARVPPQLLSQVSPKPPDSAQSSRLPRLPEGHQNRTNRWHLIAPRLSNLPLIITIIRYTFLIASVEIMKAIWLDRHWTIDYYLLLVGKSVLIVQIKFSAVVVAALIVSVVGLA